MWDWEWTEGMWFALYGLIAFLAVSGNLLVMYVILSRPRMQTVTNYFIINLAVGDAITGLLAIPFKFQVPTQLVRWVPRWRKWAEEERRRETGSWVQAALLQRWVLPDFMCQLVPFIETVSLSVSVFTLSGTAIDRFRAVVFPLRPKMTKSAAKFPLTLPSRPLPADVAVQADNLLHLDRVPGLLHALRPLPQGRLPRPQHHRPHVPAPVRRGRLVESLQRLPHHHPSPLTLPFLLSTNFHPFQYFVPLFIINGAYCVIGYKVYSTDTGSAEDPRTKSFQQSKRRVMTHSLPF